MFASCQRKGMQSEILKKAQEWGQNSYFSQEDRQEILTLIDQLPKTEKELTERFYQSLEFGTGGMRSIIGQGINRMNRYTVRRATQALATSIKKHFTNDLKVAVSYDSRHFSYEFAQEACTVFAANNIKSFLFKELTPTPILSFAIRHLKGHGGVMITASHNPPKYNGYKAFWNDGAQVVPPVDQEIISAYESLENWNDIKFMSFDEAVQKKLVEFIGDDIYEAFYEVVLKKANINLDLCQKYGSELNIVYTPLHGTGLKGCTTIAKRLGFTNFHVVEAQAKADGNFPTVKFPNPEDPEALKLSVDQMLRTKADLVYGTDPDCDRLGVVVNNHGTPYYLNGNQIGALFVYYIFKARSENKTLPRNPVVIKSIVTSDLQDAIASHYQGTVYATLTGFKWMANKILDLEKKDELKRIVFASEESFGYMPHFDCRDKDGVGSVALMSEMALYFKRQNKNLVEAMNEIYEKFGFYRESLLACDYEGIEGSKKIQRIMSEFREKTPKEIAGLSISQIDDYKKGVDNLPTSNVIGLTFSTGDKLFLRPSGTEPKIKFYVMVNDKQGSLAEKQARAEKKIEQIETYLKAACERI